MEKKYKVLIIEDDQFLLKVYSNKLMRDGFNVVVAISGDEGLNKIMSEKPDLILLDIILPQRNGFDILSEVKENPEVKDIPVVIMSNLGQESDIKMGLKLGAVDYIVKTDFSITQLPTIVRKYIQTD